MMTSRQRVHAVLNGRPPDRIPFNFWMDRNLMRSLDQKFGNDFRITHYGADVLETFPSIDWNCGLPRHAHATHKTSWQTAPSLPNLADIRKLQFAPPSPATYQNLLNDRKRFPDIALFALITTPFEGFLNLRMMQNAMMDFHDDPDAVSHYINTGGELLTEIVKGLKICDVDVLYLAGDICSSQGAMFSPELLRKFCFDPLKNAITAAHDLNLKVFLHSDGNLTNVLHLYEEYNIDGCNPLQPHLNDSAAFKKKHNLLLYGGLDNCFTIPNSTPDGVRQHILNQYKILGKTGGLIFSSHDIPDHVPLQNIDTMVQTIKDIPI